MSPRSSNSAPGEELTSAEGTGSRVKRDKLVKQPSNPAPKSLYNSDGRSAETRVTLYEGDLRIPVKALRHTIKTIHPRAGIAPDHSRQLLGHEAVGIGERVYLHQHGPSLSRAAAKAEEYIRGLMGETGA